jgi:phenylpropionate dioxygenase-like ring-hydroxylating dioxygenase large terminal subunit
MYINFWYPIALSHEVTNEKPFKVKLLNMNVVAFRDSNEQPIVLSDVCVHRGGSLGLGKVKADCVECPYHGWQFNSAGECTFIPTQATTKPPNRAKVDSYPTQEKYGIVFAFMGDLPEAERPPLYEIKEFEAEGWRANRVFSFDLKGYFERSIENGMDMAHNEFVHPNQGAPAVGETLRKHPIKIDENPPWGCGFLQPFNEKGASEETKLIGAGQGSTIAGSAHHGPNTLITRIIFSAERQFLQVFFEAPVDYGNTRIFFVNMRDWMLGEDKDEKLIDVNMQIAHEDIRIIETLDPVQTPDSTTRELLTEADKPVLRYREYLAEWQSKGWKIDRESLESQLGKAAFAIPSPARRDEKGWVIQSIPLVKS